MRRTDSTYPGSGLGLAALLCLPCYAATAVAHPGHDVVAGPAAGLVAGLVHPFTGLDHLLAMLTLGVWAAFLGRKALPGVLLPFVGGAVAGLLAGSIGLTVWGLEPGIALSVLVAGVVLAAGWRTLSARTLPLVMGVVAIFGAFHGLAHGLELPAGASTAEFLVGFLLGSSLLIGGGWLATCGARRLGRLELGGWPTRLAGAAVAIAGGLLLAGV